MRSDSFYWDTYLGLFLKEGVGGGFYTPSWLQHPINVQTQLNVLPLLEFPPPPFLCLYLFISFIFPLNTFPFWKVFHLTSVSFPKWLGKYRDEQNPSYSTPRNKLLRSLFYLHKTVILRVASTTAVERKGFFALQMICDWSSSLMRWSLRDDLVSFFAWFTCGKKVSTKLKRKFI